MLRVVPLLVLSGRPACEVCRLVSASGVVVITESASGWLACPWCCGLAQLGERVWIGLNGPNWRPQVVA